MRLLLFLCFAAVLAAQPAYDVLLKNGQVIDPKSNLNARRDVAIANGKIAAVAPSIDPSQARKVIDLGGLYVSPGFIDLHVHVFYGDNAQYSDGGLSVLPDSYSFRSGTTTMVDAGTAGSKNFEIFKKRIIDRSKTRVLSFVNIVGAGMGGAVEQNKNDMDPQLIADLKKKYPELIVGVKTAHYAGPEWVAVDNAVKAGEMAKIPVMVDFGVFHVERPHQELILKHLRPGDMYTHMYLPAVPMFDDKGKVRPYLFEGRKRGVLFDVGHGGGSFVFRYAVPAIQQGFLPDSISTDLHANSSNGGMKDMANVMSKFLNMGMTIEQVIRASTWNPARQIQRPELGNLSVGSPADVTVFSIQKGDYGFIDVYGAKLKGTQMIVAEMTFKGGKLHWDLNGLGRPSWDKQGQYGPLSDFTWDGIVSSGVRGRK